MSKTCLWAPDLNPYFWSLCLWLSFIGESLTELHWEEHSNFISLPQLHVHRCSGSNFSCAGAFTWPWWKCPTCSVSVQLIWRPVRAFRLLQDAVGNIYLAYGWRICYRAEICPSAHPSLFFEQDTHHCVMFGFRVGLDLSSWSDSAQMRFLSNQMFKVRQLKALLKPYFTPLFLPVVWLWFPFIETKPNLARMQVKMWFCTWKKKIGSEVMPFSL